MILQTEGVWNVAIATSAMFAIDIELLFVCTRAAIAVLTIAAVVACLRRGYRYIFEDVDETPLTIRDMVPGWIAPPCWCCSSCSRSSTLWRRGLHKAAHMTRLPTTRVVLIARRASVCGPLSIPMLHFQ